MVFLVAKATSSQVTGGEGAAHSAEPSKESSGTRVDVFTCHPRPRLSVATRSSSIHIDTCEIRSVRDY